MPDVTQADREVAWHSPLGGLIEAQTHLRNARQSVETAKEQNGHIPGRPYNVAENALNFALAEVHVLIDTLHRSPDTARIAALEEALRWYGEQARLARSLISQRR